MMYEDLIGNVTELERSIGATEPIYFESVGKLSDVRDDLRRLDVDLHLLGIVGPFLIRWGTMARVVDREGLDWKGFCQKLDDLEPEFASLRGKRFIALDFDDEVISSAIKTTYGELGLFPRLGGPTSVSKVLHLLNPEIFVMWDGNIRRAYNRKNRLVNEFSEGYLEFLKQAQREIGEAFKDCQSKSGKEYDVIEKEIRDKFRNKTLARIVDEYNYSVCTFSHSSNFVYQDK
jgi:hypothetical protein